jgi:hypothetical protein
MAFVDDPSAIGTLRVANMNETLRVIVDMNIRGITLATFAGYDASVLSIAPLGGIKHIILNNIATLYSLRGEPNTRTVFGTLITTMGMATAASAVAPVPTIIDDCRADILSILSFAGGGASTQTMQAPMFKALLADFKQKVIDAAGMVTPPNTSLISALNAGALMNPEALFRSTRLAKPQPVMFSMAEELVRYISRGRSDTTKYFDQNKEIIKERLMKSVGTIGIDQQKQVELDRKKEEMKRMDPSKLGVTPPPGTPRPKPLEVEKPHDVTADQFTNPAFLTALSVFFMQYYKYIASLPV